MVGVVWHVLPALRGACSLSRLCAVVLVFLIGGFELSKILAFFHDTGQ